MATDLASVSTMSCSRRRECLSVIRSTKFLATLCATATFVRVSARGCFGAAKAIRGTATTTTTMTKDEKGYDKTLKTAMTITITGKHDIDDGSEKFNQNDKYNE